MKLVEEMIINKGHILGEDILKVDSFVNHQIDTKFVDEVGKYFANSFSDFNKVLTIESSGIAFAITTALHKNHIPVVFAKKRSSKILDTSTCYHKKIKSFTKKEIFDVFVDKKYLNPGDKVLIVDDFLANGESAIGLINIIKQSNAEVVGVCAVINKVFQGGEERIKDLGIKVVSGARITGFKDNKVQF